MPTKHDTPDWSHHVRAFQNSGLSRAEYCRRAGIDYDQFRYYSKELNTHFATPAPKSDATVDIDGQHTSTDFVPITLVDRRDQESKSEFTLTKADGSTLSWSTEWTPAQVFEFAMEWNAKC